jgi:arylsulfatase A-like enzyme
MTLRFFSVVLFFCLLLGASDKPNIILIMGDDIGFSDIGCYGSEIATPNLDKLAMSGMRFTQFYNMAKCDPTRSSLLTGIYLPRKNKERVQALPQLMRKAGYYTAMSGKEHFNNWVPKHVYAKESFEDSFVYWAINNYFIPLDGKFRNPFTLNGKQLKINEIIVNKKPFYKTDVVTDYALQFLDKAVKQKKPFFLYLAFHPGHYPLQARPEDIAKYKGKYKKGWDKIKQERFDRQKKLGVISASTKLSPPSDNINNSRGPYRGNIYKYRPWATLPTKEQDELDLEMAVFAAMVDNMDQNIGRLVTKLNDSGVRENTLILFLSDNGSCPYDSNVDFTIPPGGANSYRSLSAAWANVGNTPFRFFKQYGHQGGALTHFIANGPGVAKKSLCDQPAHLVDIYPTLLELAETQYPKNSNGASIPKLDGTTLVPLFKGTTRTQPELIISGNGKKFRMVRSGDWKIVKVNGQAWELYNLKEDPTELKNLAKTMPEKVQNIEKISKNYHSNK